MGPTGVGMWLWLIDSCEGGDVEAIANKAVEYGITWVAPKAQQGTGWYLRNRGKIKALAQALHARGIEVYPWGWIYGRSPNSPYASIARLEGERALEVVYELEADGYIVDAEKDWKRTHLNMAAEAPKFMEPLERISVPVLVSSYRYPDVHREFPWIAWNKTLKSARGDGWAPQVYWEQDFRARAGSIQLQRTFEQYGAWGLLADGRSFHPAPAAYSRGGWYATAKQITDFTKKVEELRLPSYIPWSWQHMWAEHWAALLEDWYRPEGAVIEPPPPNGNGDLPDPDPDPVPLPEQSENVRLGAAIRVLTNFIVEGK